MTSQKDYTWLKVTPITPRIKHHSIPRINTLDRQSKPIYQSEILTPTTLILKEVRSIKVVEIQEDESRVILSKEIKAQETLNKTTIGNKMPFYTDRYLNKPRKRDHRTTSFGINIAPKFMNSIRWINRKAFVPLLLATISLIGSISVVGLLQSLESVGSSGIIVQNIPSLPIPSLPNTTPPEPKIDINIYSDSECTVTMTKVEWGSIEAGSSIDRIVYLKNAGDSEVMLSLLIDNFDPVNATEYMGVSWNYDGEPVESGAIVEIILTLTVDTSIPVLGEFTFDIVFVGSAL